MQRGFTLLEMVLVLTIVSLVIGGIVGGANLLEASRLNDVLTRAGAYRQAVHEFQDVYAALPGDMSRASSIWNGAGNGNGNGQISTIQWANAARYENSYAWQHLASAGLIAGSYATPASATSSFVPDVNIPRGPFPTSGFNLLYVGRILQSDTGIKNAFFAGDHGNVILFGSSTSSNNANSLGTGQIISAPAAQALDTKVDDGRPGTGAVTSTRGDSTSDVPTNCATTNDPATSVYDVSLGDAIVCSLLFAVGK